MEIITLDDYKAYVGINSPTKDVQLQVYIDFVNDFIPAYCGLSFSEEIKTQVPLTMDESSIIFINDFPLVSIEKLEYVDPTNIGTDMSLDNCIVDYDVGEIYLGLIPSETGTGTFPMSTRQYAYRVSYTSGHSTVPASIALAAYELVTHYEKEKWMGSKTIGNGQSVSYTDKRYLPPHIKNALDMYRRV